MTVQTFWGYVYMFVHDTGRDLMLTPIAGEITEREPYNGYLIFQGGIPEVEEFIRKFHK